MKKIFSKPYCFAITLIILYFLVVFSGVFAVVAYPVFQQRGFLFEKARVIAQEYPQGKMDTINDITGRNMGIYVYAADGECLFHTTSTAFPADDIMFRLDQELLPTVLTGTEKYKLMSFKTGNLNLATGVPILSNTGVDGAVLLVKLQVDLYGSIIGFLLFFSVLYWLCAYIIFTYVRKKQKLELVQQNYIANVTHALKSPIAAVKTLTETLCDVENMDTTTQRTYYGLILQEMNQQSHMVQEILELSKLQSRERDFAKDFINARETFAPILEKYTMLCDCAHISLRVSDTISELPPLYTNASCVKQVLEILLENALKYAEVGCAIDVEASVVKNQVVFCVRDNGIGIATEDLPYVFDRFYKCNRNKSGSGLGLAIAKEIINGLKERIWVESELEKGTAFFFSVRLK